MIIYLHGSPDKPPVAEHTVFVAPGAMSAREGSPSDWWEKTGTDERPKQFAVQFFHGQAEVDDRLGKYMIDNGMAFRTKLIIPAPWER